MNVFALDSSGKTAGAAIISNGALLYESYLANGLTHSETLMPLSQNAFEITGLAPSDIDLFCVCAGPGSFTGLRIGMALIKGLAFGTKALCAGVSTLEALAYSCVCDGTVICALNARRGEVYHAAFKRKGDIVTRLYPDSASHASELCEFAKGAESPIILMGDGASIVKNALGEDISSKLYPEQYIFGRAHAAGLCGIDMHSKGLAKSPAELEINYCRLSQAERERIDNANE